MVPFYLLGIVLQAYCNIFERIWLVTYARIASAGYLYKKHWILVSRSVEILFENDVF